MPRPFSTIVACCPAEPRARHGVGRFVPRLEALQCGRGHPSAQPCSRKSSRGPAEGIRRFPPEGERNAASTIRSGTTGASRPRPGVVVLRSRPLSAPAARTACPEQRLFPALEQPPCGRSRTRRRGPSDSGCRRTRVIRRPDDPLPRTSHQAELTLAGDVGKEAQAVDSRKPRAPYLSSPIRSPKRSPRALSRLGGVALERPKPSHAEAVDWAP